MEKHFVTYDQALDLKDLGFKESCFGEWRQWDGGYPWLQLYQDLDGCSTDDSDYQYTTEALAPLKSQVFEWARKTHNISHAMKPIIGSKNGYDSYPILGWDSDLFILTKGATNSYYMGYPVGEWFTATLDCFDEGDTLEDIVNPRSYEDAESDCIDKLIKAIKNV